MTKDTIHSKNERGKKKIGEILRLKKAMAVLNIQPIDIADKTGLSQRTIENCLYGNNPIGGKLLRQLHSKYGLSIDWLIAGTGQMMAQTENEIAEEKQIYSSDNPRTERIINQIKDWMSYADPDQQAWLETELKFKILHFVPHLDKKKDGE